MSVFTTATIEASKNGYKLLMQMGLARSLVGLSSVEAEEMRRKYLTDPDALLRSYTGVDTAEAWNARYKIFDKITTTTTATPDEVSALVASLSGLTSEKSWGARKALTSHLTLAQQAHAINSNYLLAAVRAEQRRKKSLML